MLLFHIFLVCCWTFLTTFTTSVIAEEAIPNPAASQMAAQSQFVPKELEPYAAGHDFQWDGPIIAMGDIHGDGRNAVALLYKKKLIDMAGNWIGGNTMLIQMGDIVDRGPDTRMLYALFRRLKEQASKAGGKVVTLVGNHEPMQLCGMLQYVHPQDFSSYGSPASRFFSYSVKGTDGLDIRNWEAAIMVNGTLFSHAGLAPEYAQWGLETLNTKVRSAMNSCNDELIWEERGPLWNRVFSMGADPIACRELAVTLDKLGAERMIVGHTIQDGGVRLRCAGRLILADTGASRFINNTPTMVEFVDIGKNSKSPRNDEVGGAPSGKVYEISLDISALARDAKPKNVMDSIKLTRRALIPDINTPPFSAWKGPR